MREKLEIAVGLLLLPIMLPIARYARWVDNAPTR